jgi:hypothetical protein
MHDRIQTLEGDLVFNGLRRMETQEFGEFAAVLSILMNTELEIFAEGLIELLEVVFVLSYLREHIHALLDDVLADNFKDLVLLKCLTRDVKRQVLRINDTLDKVEVLRNEVLTVVHNEDTADVEFDVVALFLTLKQIERCTRTRSVTDVQCNDGDVPLRDIKDSLELKLTLDGEVLDSKMVLPVVGKRLVEGTILLLRDVVRVTRPDRLRLVELLVDLALLLDLLCFLFVLSFVLIVVLNLLDLCLSFFILSFFDFFFLVILDLL